MPASNLIDPLSYYTNFAAPRDTRADHEQGARDGEGNYPPHDQVGLSPHELDLVSQGRSDLARFRSTVANERNACAGFAARQKQMRLEQYESERRDIASRYDQDLEALNFRLGPASRVAQSQEFGLFEAEQSYDALARQENREPAIHFVAPRLFFSPYVWLLCLLAVAELTINRTIFEGLMRTSALQAYGLAILFGVTVVFLAHCLGLLTRQRKVARTPWERLRVRLGVPLIAVLVVGLFYEMSVIRQVQFVREGAQAVGDGASGLLPSLLARPMVDAVAGAGRGVLDAGTSALTLSSPFHALTVGGLTLFLINLIAFLAGVLLSYFRHDSHPDYEALGKARDVSRANLATRQRQYEEQVLVIAENYRRQHTNLTARSDRLQREIEQEQIHIDTLGRRVETETDKVFNVITQRVLAYQSGNNRARNESPPAYFGEPTIALIRRLLLEPLGVYAPNPAMAEPQGMTVSSIFDIE